MNKYLLNFKNNLRNIIEMRKISIVDLAKKTGLTAASFYFYIDPKDTRSPSLESAAAIANVLGFTLSQMIEDKIDGTVFHQESTDCLKVAARKLMELSDKN